MTWAEDIEELQPVDTEIARLRFCGRCGFPLAVYEKTRCADCIGAMREDHDEAMDEARHDK